MVLHRHQRSGVLNKRSSAAFFGGLFMEHIRSSCPGILAQNELRLGTRAPPKGLTFQKENTCWLCFAKILKYFPLKNISPTRRQKGVKNVKKMTKCVIGRRANEKGVSRTRSSLSKRWLGAKSAVRNGVSLGQEGPLDKEGYHTCIALHCQLSAFCKHYGEL